MERIIKCPRCGRATKLEANPFRPFCSERCRLLDLGNWLDGAYGVPGTADEEEDSMPDPEGTSADS